MRTLPLPACSVLASLVAKAEVTTRIFATGNGLATITCFPEDDPAGNDHIQIVLKDFGVPAVRYMSGTNVPCITTSNASSPSPPSGVSSLNPPVKQMDSPERLSVA